MRVINRMIKVIIVVDEEMLLLERERVSRDRNVKRVMRESIMNDLRDEIRIRNRGRERRRRFKSFANARDISVNKFLIVKEVLNEKRLIGRRIESMGE